MTKCIALILLVTITLTGTAAAQDLAIPAVPGGISPLLSWVLTVMGSVLTLIVPILALWLRTYLLAGTVQAKVQTAQARSAMIDKAVVRAAYLANTDMVVTHKGLADLTDTAPIMAQAIGYVGGSVPDGIAATPQADDAHIAEMIRAEIRKLQLTPVATPGK